MSADTAVVVTSVVGFVVAFGVTIQAIPLVMKTLLDHGIFGIDMNKTTAEQRAKIRSMKNSGKDDNSVRRYIIPESSGIVVGGVYLCVAAVLLFVCGFPLLMANAALSTIAFALLLGFVDDVLDIRWRYKIILSAFSTLPLLASYNGPMSILVPIPLRPLVGSSTVNLGVMYLAYIGLFCIFCNNSINILAGVNGVEVGQSIVIAVAQIIHNLVQWKLMGDESQLISVALLAPFVGVSLALFYFNKYPSRVFVGDSYTYFAGMTLAVAGITGQYTKTLVLFFTPQLINFTISLPQLFNIVPCPRHRVPSWNPRTDRLSNSHNYTILNAILFFLGDLHERTLTNAFLLFQVFCCCAAFFVRYYLAGLVYEVVQ